MPRPRKYDGLHDRQAAYHQTEKGKAAVKKYESSERAKARKRRWWQEHKASEPVDMRRQFIDTYGEPNTVLDSLNERERQVISLYFGLEGKAHTLEEIGSFMGISKQWVGQIKSGALKKILSGEPIILDKTGQPEVLSNEGGTLLGDICLHPE